MERVLLDPTSGNPPYGPNSTAAWRLPCTTKSPTISIVPRGEVQSKPPCYRGLVIPKLSREQANDPGQGL